MAESNTSAASTMTMAVMIRSVARSLSRYAHRPNSRYAGAQLRRRLAQARTSGYDYIPRRWHSSANRRKDDDAYPTPNDGRAVEAAYYSDYTASFGGASMLAIM
jgi:hypothetical protein